MKLERSYQVDSKYTRPYKRTKSASLSRALAIRKPELKEAFFRVNGNIAINSISVTALSIPQGTASNQRIGDHVRIMDLTVTGIPVGLTGPPCLASLTCPKNSAGPVLGDFTSGVGNFYDINKGWVLRYWNNGSQNSPICGVNEFNYKFKMGMVQEYDGTGFIRNGLYFTVPNPNGTALTGQDCVVRVRYYDV
jgi:hypothetical protein